MEKYTDSTSPQADSENSSFLPTSYPKPDTQRRRGIIYLTLFNLFLFTLSMLSLICAVMSQKDSSGNSAAKLMDQFDVFCTSPTTLKNPSQNISRRLIPNFKKTAPAKHIVEYSQQKFTLPNPLNSSKYVGITDDVENAWMDVAYRGSLFIHSIP
jgi:hypothetical protein